MAEGVIASVITVPWCVDLSYSGLLLLCLVEYAIEEEKLVDFSKEGKPADSHGGVYRDYIPLS